MKDRRWISGKMVLALTLTASLVAQSQYPLYAVAGENSYKEYLSGENADSGKETEEQNYQEITVKTEAELCDIAEHCRLDSWSKDKLIKLEADIDLKEHTDLMIPSFAGCFDGNGHQITGIDNSSNGSAIGLFRYVQKGAQVRNLTVQGIVEPQGTRSQVGGIVGINYGSVNNCTFIGIVHADTEVGGIVGVNKEGGDIRRCQSRCTVVGNHSTGGVVGNNEGVVSLCKNKGNINTYSEEVSYELDDLTVERLQKINSTSNVAAHTDTGGIAGISYGKIYGCMNYGTVGYEHVGYNVGGIAGRVSQGYLSSCYNFGHVLGRKDVGGIAGQMEPFLEIQYLTDKLQELDTETDKLFDLLDDAQTELRGYGREATDEMKQLTSHLNNGMDAGHRLLDNADELWYIYNQELGKLGKDLRDLVGDPWESDITPLAGKKNPGGNTGDLTGAEDGPDSESAEIARIDNTDTGSSTDNGTVSGTGSSTDNGTASGTGSSTDNGTGSDTDDGNGGNLWDGSGDIPSVDDIESYMAALKKFAESASEHISVMTTETEERSGDMSADLDTFNNELDLAGENLDRLAEILEDSSDSADVKIQAISDQTKVVRNLIQGIRDDLFAYEGITVNDTSDEPAGENTGTLADGDAGEGQESAGEGQDSAGKTQDSADEAQEISTEDLYAEEIYDTSTFQKGKIEGCRNEALVEADADVGGIVGQVAIEYDIDPEDDLTYEGEESFNIERTVKAVVRDNLNRGQVIGKRDYIGGIVGKADFGAIISCESYADVESTGGSKVGGIVGESGYAVRSCYSMGNISGKNQVGGIAGKGCDIFYSYSYDTLEATGESAGSIAGTLQEDGTLYGNYYVENEFGGVDGVAYEGGATPLTYEEFKKVHVVPDVFSSFTITFRAEETELGSLTYRYGELIQLEEVPEIPEKEGYYGIWPDFDFDNVTGNAILDAEYDRWVGSVTSEQKDEQGRSLVLVQGSFLPGTKLQLEGQNGSKRISIVQPLYDHGRILEQTEYYTGPVTVRVLCDNPEKAAIEVEQNGVSTRVESEVMGSYAVFTMELTGDSTQGAYGSFCVKRAVNYALIIKLVCLVAGGILVLTVILVIKKRTAKKRNKKETGETGGQDTGSTV